MFLQVSKISVAGCFIFVLLFQQFIVGSEARAQQNNVAFPAGEDTKQDQSNSSFNEETIPDSIDRKATPDSETLILTADTLNTDTNETGDDVLDFPVVYHARDSIRVNIEDQIVYLFGAATVDYDDLHLDAEYIEIDMNRKELHAEGVMDSTGTIIGSPEFSQGPQQFRSNAINYNFNTRKGKISYVITKEGEGFIHGDIVKKDPENNFFIKHGQYTTCDLDTPHFAITSNKLKVINKKKIVTGPAYLTIESVPTPLLIPFGFFPNKDERSSGIIFPSFGESAQLGFYFDRLGYYFGFSDYVTLALTTNLYTKGSYAFDAYTLYKKRYRYNGNLALSYAKTVTSEPELPDFEVIKDFHIKWTHNQDPKFNPNNNFSASVNAGTSTFYRNTLSSTNNFLTNTFNSSINFTHIFPDLPMNYSIALSHFQNILTHDIQLVTPDASFNVSRITPFKIKNRIGREKWFEKIGTNISIRAKNQIDTKDSLLFKEESLNKFRNGILISAPISMGFNVLSYLNVTPSINTTERIYFKTTEFEWDADSMKLDTIEKPGVQSAFDYSASVALSTRVYGMYLFKKGKIEAIRHVISPSISINYRPDYGKSKYGYFKEVQYDTAGNMRTYSIFQNSIFGGPAAGPFATLNFGFDNNIEMKVRSQTDTGVTSKKIKILESLQFTSSYNLIADSMKLGLIRANGRTSLFDKVSINFSGTFDPYAFDENNIDYDHFTISDGGPLARLTDGSVSLIFNLNNSNPKESPKYSQEELDYITNHPDEYVDFSVPFNLSVNYSFHYNKRGAEPANRTQSASFNGDLSLTPRFKIGFNSWYDLTTGKFTSLGLNFYRDLHCWQMNLNWIPFGYQESWNFQINVKASILQDLKLNKKKGLYDN